MVSSQDITHNLHKLVFLLEKVAEKELQEKLNMTFSQYRILMAIDHRTVSQCDIADYWDMTEAAVSRQIETLVNDKLVKRKENKENRRENMLELTTEGEKKYKKSVKLLDNAYNELYKNIPLKDKKFLMNNL